jgi:hypothetical protein
MKSNPFDGITRPSLPTPSDIQRRMVELTGKQLQLEPQTQLQTRPAPSTPALDVWDYCSASASLFFGTSTGDHTADRILEAINASADGFLSRNQMSALFHGHLSSSRIEAALEQLISLGAIYQSSSQPSGGRPSTLWSAIPESECLAEGESHHESTLEETANEESMQEQT